MTIRNSPESSGPESPAVQRDPVLRACYECVLDFGVRRSTLAEVARRAGVSRMTVYRRHADLASLLSTVMREELTHALATSEGALPAAGDARGRAVEALATVTRVVAGHPLLSRVLDVDPEALLPLIVDRLGSTQRVAREHLAVILASGMAGRGGDGSIRDADPDLLALTLVVTAQSFVFSERVVRAADPRAFDELRHLADSYLAPERGQP
jgi:AcrR family transcriptional regulator